ncbi:hypothetical protein ACJMK2_009302, partial [Sinanodonta woodiana]
MFTDFYQEKLFRRNGNFGCSAPYQNTAFLPGNDFTGSVQNRGNFFSEKIKKEEHTLSNNCRLYPRNNASEIHSASQEYNVNTFAQTPRSTFGPSVSHPVSQNGGHYSSPFVAGRKDEQMQPMFSSSASKGPDFKRPFSGLLGEIAKETCINYHQTYKDQKHSEKTSELKSMSKFESNKIISLADKNQTLRQCKSPHLKHPLHSKDPVLWTSSDVKHWLGWFLQEHGIHDFDINKFSDVDGRMLCNMSREEHTKLFGIRYADILSRNLAMLRQSSQPLLMSQTQRVSQSTTSGQVFQNVWPYPVFRDSLDSSESGQKEIGACNPLRKLEKTHGMDDGVWKPQGSIDPYKLFGHMSSKLSST